MEPLDETRVARIRHNLHEWGQHTSGWELTTPPALERLNTVCQTRLCTARDAAVLWAAASRGTPGKALEIGRFCGYTTALLALCGWEVTSLDLELPRQTLAECAPQHLSHLDTMFPGWQTLGDCARETLTRVGVDERCVLLQGDSQDPLAWPDEVFQLVVVDASHSEVCVSHDVEHAVAHLGHGVLVAHDYDLYLHDVTSGVDLAWDRFLETHQGFDGPGAVAGSSYVWVVKV